MISQNLSRRLSIDHSAGQCPDSNAFGYWAIRIYLRQFASCGNEARPRFCSATNSFQVCGCSPRCFANKQTQRQLVAVPSGTGQIQSQKKYLWGGLGIGPSSRLLRERIPSANAMPYRWRDSVKGVSDRDTPWSGGTFCPSYRWFAFRRLASRSLTMLLDFSRTIAARNVPTSLLSRLATS